MRFLSLTILALSVVVCLNGASLGQVESSAVAPATQVETTAPVATAPFWSPEAESTATAQEPQAPQQGDEMPQAGMAAQQGAAGEQAVPQQEAQAQEGQAPAASAEQPAAAVSAQEPAAAPETIPEVVAPVGAQPVAPQPAAAPAAPGAPPAGAVGAAG